MLPPNTNYNSKRTTRLLICLVIVLAIFVVVVRPAAFLGALWLSERQKRAERAPQVRVPNVIGQDSRNGEAMLQEKGLRMRVLAKRSDQHQPVDIILDQNPLGGESVDIGYVVGVTIGTQPP